MNLVWVFHRNSCEKTYNSNGFCEVRTFECSEDKSIVLKIHSSCLLPFEEYNLKPEPFSDKHIGLF